MAAINKFCVYAADNHEAYIAGLEQAGSPEETDLEHDGLCYKAVRHYEIDRNELVEFKRPLNEQAMINARWRKSFAPDLSEFLLKWAERDYPERADEARASLEKAEATAKRTLYDIFREEKRKLKENPKKPYKARIKTYKEYLYPAVHRRGLVYFSTLDDALDALYNAWKDQKNDWDKPGKMEEMFQGM